MGLLMSPKEVTVLVSLGKEEFASESIEQSSAQAPATASSSQSVFYMSYKDLVDGMRGSPILGTLLSMGNIFSTPKASISCMLLFLSTLYSTSCLTH